MRKFIWLSFIALLSAACVSHSVKTDGYVIEGELEGLGNKSIRFSYHDTINHESYLNDTIRAKNNKFSIKGKVKKEDWAYIYILDTTLNIYTSGGGYLQGKVARLFLTNDRITVKGKYDEANVVTITGNELNEGISTYSNLISDHSRRGTEIQRKIVATENEEEKSKLVAEYSQIIAKMKDITFQFIKDNPDEQYTAKLLSERLYNMNIDEINSYYNSLSERVKQSKYGKIVGDKIEAAEKTEIGKNIVDFELPDMNNDIVKTKDLRGNVLLIDFWGSWCVPCRNSHPHLRELYGKYKNKGFEMIGVAKENSEKSWRSAIEEDQLSWIQINGSAHLEEINLFQEFFVNAFPTKVLVDRNGKIVFRMVGYKLKETEKLENKLAELLGE